MSETEDEKEREDGRKERIKERKIERKKTPRKSGDQLSIKAHPSSLRAIRQKRVARSENRDFFDKSVLCESLEGPLVIMVM